MRWLKRLVRTLIRGDEGRAVDEELRLHLEMEAEELERAGVSRQEARRRARVAFGGVERYRMEARDVRRAPWLGALGGDLRDAVRSLLNYPRYSLTSIVTLVVAVGIVASVFTVFNAVYIRPWPVPDPDEVFVVALRQQAGAPEGAPGWTNPTYEEFFATRERSTRARLVAYHDFGTRIERSGAEEPAGVLIVSRDFFEVLRVPFQHGRGFAYLDSGEARTAVLSSRLWQRLFGGDPGVVGTVVSLNDVPTTIVGVLSPGFAGIPPERADVYVPFPAKEDWTLAWSRLWGADSDPSRQTVDVVGRLAPGWSREEAAAELSVLYRQAAGSIEGGTAPGTLTLWRTAAGRRPNGEIRSTLLGVFVLLFASTLLVLLLACANVANLQLARSLARSREIATRIALGASRWRIVRQLLVEGLLQACLAGAGAVAVASILPSLILGEEGESTAFIFAPDMTVLLFSLLVCVFTAAAFALVPALQTTRHASPPSSMRTGRFASRSMGWTRALILASQVAISMVLLVGAILLVRGVHHAMSPEYLGFDGDGAIAFLRDGGGQRIWKGADSLTPQLLTAVRSGVEAGVTFAVPAPLEGAFRWQSVRMLRQSGDDSQQLIEQRVASNFFDVLGVPLVAGRAHSDDAPHEVVVNQAFMRAFASAGASLGSQVVIADTVHTIVGIARDARFRYVDAVWPSVFQPLSSGTVPTIVLRRNDPATAARLSVIARSIDPDAGLEIIPFKTTLESQTRSSRMGALLASIVGFVALALAVVGVFGVFGCYVEERRREIGIRIALGAHGTQVVALLFGAARRALVYGVLAGSAAGLAGAIVLRGFLYGLSPLDPLSYGAVAAILVGAAVAATYAPARRAIRVDPAVTLRCE